jgi:hypothetical protein
VHCQPCRSARQRSSALPQVVQTSSNSSSREQGLSLMGEVVCCPLQQEAARGVPGVPGPQPGGCGGVGLGMAGVPAWRHGWGGKGMFITVKN